MTDTKILELIKEKRLNAYYDYEHNIQLNMKDSNIQSYQARKETIKGLQIAINTYDDLIIILE
nr:hypothetical protein [Acholeplasmatales bacterium]